MIKAVIFDIDGVLLDSFEANYKFFTDLLNKFGYPGPTLEEHQRTFHNTMEDIIKIVSKSESEEEIHKIWLAGKNKEVPYPAHLAPIPEELGEVIEALHKDFLLGIVTSREKSGIFETLPQLVPFKKYFQAVISHEDTEKHKPHPDPLHLAAKKLKISPEKCVYIGDSESDMVAAKAAGMKSIIYSKNVSKNADACTFVFGELPKLIKKL